MAGSFLATVSAFWRLVLCIPRLPSPANAGFDMHPATQGVAVLAGLHASVLKCAINRGGERERVCVFVDVRDSVFIEEDTIY